MLNRAYLPTAVAIMVAWTVWQANPAEAQMGPANPAMTCAGSGMMGSPSAGGPNSPATVPTVSADQATQLAQHWLDQYQPGSTTEAPDAFYGYYTLHSLKDGTITGMLSVNAYTGQVWYHTWHGAFIGMRELGG